MACLQACQALGRAVAPRRQQITRACASHVAVSRSDASGNRAAQLSTHAALSTSARGCSAQRRSVAARAAAKQGAPHKLEELLDVRIRSHSSCDLLRCDSANALVGFAQPLFSAYSFPLNPIPSVSTLRQVAKRAAAAGAAVVSDALDKPRNITFKGATDLVTECADGSVLAASCLSLCHRRLLPPTMALQTASAELRTLSPKSSSARPAGC